MSDRETLRIIDRALWVAHPDGNLDGLTGELPIWADEWAERIVAAVNGRQVIETIGEVDALPVGAILADRGGDAWQLLPGGWRCPALDNEWMDRSDDWFTAADALAEGPLTVLYLPIENGDTK